MSSPHPPPADEERRRLFRRMEWLYVWAPPLVAVLVSLAVGAGLAWFFRVEGTSFWQRWLGAAFLILAIPAGLYAAREWWRR